VKAVAEASSAARAAKERTDRIRNAPPEKAAGCCPASAAC